RPWDLFLRLCGGNPDETREPGSPERQGEVNPVAEEEPLRPDERIHLDQHLYSDFPQRLKDELDPSWYSYTSDANVRTILREFSRRAAEPEVVALLRRAHEAPGPTLASKTQRLGV